ALLGAHRRRRAVGGAALRLPLAREGGGAGAARRRRAPRAGAGAADRPGHQRHAALDPPRAGVLPAGRAGEARARSLPRGVPREKARRAGRLPYGRPAAAARGRPAGGARAGAARPRQLHDADRAHVRAPLSRGQPRQAPRMGGGSGAAADRARGVDGALPHAADHRVRGSVGRPARQRLSDHPVVARPGQRRPRRPGHRRQQAEAVLPAGVPHRFHFCHRRRGARIRRRGGDRRAVRRPHLARAADWAPGAGRVRRLSRARHHRAAGHADAREPRRRHRAAADQGAAAAVHLVRGIAEILLNLGYRVTGSDIRRSETIERLEALGAKVFIGHEAAHVEGAHVVVYSSAVARDNIEVQVARQRAIPVIPRAEMLAELMRLKYGIAVAGTHGKTTTTSMVGAVLAEGRYDPTIVVGGRVINLGSNARLGQGDFLVAEADESDGSFLTLAPTIAVVTTVDAEHLDHYGTLDAIREAFVRFVNKVPFYGSAVLCLDQPNIQMLIPRVEKRAITYGLESSADLVARRLSLSGMTSRFEVYQRGSLLGECTLQIPGRHNVLNALAAIGVGLELEIPFVTMERALAGF